MSSRLGLRLSVSLLSLSCLPFLSFLLEQAAAHHVSALISLPQPLRTSYSCPALPLQGTATPSIGQPAHISPLECHVRQPRMAAVDVADPPAPHSVCLRWGVQEERRKLQQKRGPNLLLACVPVVCVSNEYLTFRAGKRRSGRQLLAACSLALVSTCKNTHLLTLE